MGVTRFHLLRAGSFRGFADCLIGADPEKLEIMVVVIVMKIVALVLNINIDIFRKPQRYFVSPKLYGLVIKHEMLPLQSDKRDRLR